MSEEDEYTPRPEDEEPIAALATLVEPPPRTLGTRIRASIQRRMLAADVAESSLLNILHVFMEFLSVVFESLRGVRGDGERSDTGEDQ